MFNRSPEDSHNGGLEESALATRQHLECWYALRVRPRAEKSVAASLGSQNFETFLPLCRSLRQWSDRQKVLELPLFAGYLFFRASPRRLWSATDLQGVIEVVGVGGRPAPLPEEEIAAVRAIVASGLRPEPHPYLAKGQRVRICEGSLSGMEGILIRCASVDRLVVSIELLQRSVSVEIDRAWAEPVASDRKAS